MTDVDMLGVDIPIGLVEHGERDVTMPHTRWCEPAPAYVLHVYEPVDRRLGIDVQRPDEDTRHCE